MKFLSRRRLLIAGALLVFAAVSAALGLSLLVNSPATNEKLRQYVVRGIEAQTGGRASLSRLYWSLRQRRIVLEDLTIRGTEPDIDPPLLHVGSIAADVNLRTLLQKRIDLSGLTITRPEFRIIVEPGNRTNLPTPPKGAVLDTRGFTVSIDTVAITGGNGFINDRPVNIDLKLNKLEGSVTYQPAREVLSAKVTYSGVFTRGGQPEIPYSLSADLDVTGGAVIVQRAQISEGRSALTVHGRVDRVLVPEISARLEYSGNIHANSLSRFFPGEMLSGVAATNGVVEATLESFSAKGSLDTKRAELNGRAAEAVRLRYEYKSADRKLSLDTLSANLLGGNVKGTATADLMQSPPRVTADIEYVTIDAAQLAAYYPWDSRYIVYSTASGKAHGWFEGSMDRFEFEGTSELTAYPPRAVTGTIAFPVTGTLHAVLRPQEAEIRSSNLRFFDTTVRATGRIRQMQAALAVDLESTDLANLYFLHKEANGSGSFHGTVNGPLDKPQLDGRVVLDQYKHGNWTIRHAEGRASFDAQTEMANLAVTGSLGESTGSVTGTTKVDGSNMNLRIQSDRIRAADFQSVIKEKVDGILSGDVTLTSLNPARFRGHVRVTGLTIRGETIETAEGDVAVDDPTVDLRNLAASSRGARLTSGTIRFNRNTEAVDAQVDVSGLNLERVRDLGVPPTLEGNLQRGRFRVVGTIRQPVISGEGSVEALAFHGETFPQARLTLATEWPVLNATLTDAGNVDLTARIRLNETNYPFDASARFRNYSLEKLARFSLGTLSATGEASLKGVLAKDAPIEGTGTIREVHAKIGEYAFDGSKPFAFKFDSTEIELMEDAFLSGSLGTAMTIRGSVGLGTAPRLALRADGTLDLRVLSELDPQLSITGTVAFDGRIGGTTARPTLDGIARVSNGSLGREGIYTTLSMLNGEVRFNENRVTLDNLTGRATGGTVRIQGTGLYANKQLEAMNIRIEADQLRFRYPAGLRSSFSGSLVLKGTSSQPILDGNLHIEQLAYRNDFEAFLATFRSGGLESGGTSLDNLRLSIHVAGTRNIGIQNELAEVTSARVDLDIKGTLGNPSLTGHVETNDGTLLFQGKRYTITRGNIALVDPLRIDPVIDVQAETDLRDYRVILTVTGRGDRVHVEFRSDPPLPQLELVSLIAGGKTRDELAAESGAASLPTSEQLFQGGAASILVDLLRSRVGGRFGLLGLENVRIDPYVVGTGTSPSTRITLSERVTKDLSVTYSQDLASSQQRVIQIEYFISKNFSLVASREETAETTALGLDVRLRKRF